MSLEGGGGEGEEGRGRETGDGGGGDRNSMGLIGGDEGMGTVCGNHKEITPVFPFLGAWPEALRLQALPG